MFRRSLNQRRVSWRRIRRIASSFILLLSVGNLFRKAFDCKQHTITPRAAPRRLSEKRPSILYIVTSLAEYDNGTRETQKGRDRFHSTLVPILRESAISMMESGYKVDVHLISHFLLRPERYDELRKALPSDIGLEVWDEATPLGYVLESSTTKIENITRALARQHRYVIKEKLLDYDIFVNFEDDMLIKGDHVRNFVEVTNELYRLRQEAPEQLNSNYTPDAMLKVFHGPMTKTQLKRMIPGFIRVEAALPGWEPIGMNLYEQIPIDRQWNGSSVSPDPSICCHVSKETANDHIPQAPRVEDLYFWETSIDALGVRKMPQQNFSNELDWVLLLATSISNPIGDYWSGDGESAYFGDKPRPDRVKGRYLNNQGGWMATRWQLFEWHQRLCRGGFLP